MDLREHRTRIVEALAGLPIRVVPYMTPDPKTPCGLLKRGLLDPQENLGGFRRSRWVLKLMAPTQNAEGAAQLMDEWCSLNTPNSILDAFAAADPAVIDISSPSVGEEHYETNQDGTVLYLVSDVEFDAY